MLRQFLNGVQVTDLPLIATGIFIAMFLAVLIRVSQRTRKAEYRHMGTLPLANDAAEEQHK